MADESQIPMREQLTALKIMWRLAMATPAAYMFIGLMVGKFAFDDNSVGGFGPMDGGAYRTFLYITAFAVGAMSFAVFRLMGRRGRPTEENIRAYRTKTYVILVIGDTMAFLGLVMYLIQGDALAQGILSLLAWFHYYVGRPQTDDVFLERRRS